MPKETIRGTSAYNPLFNHPSRVVVAHLQFKRTTPKATSTKKVPKT